jgi:hypothetical protein
MPARFRVTDWGHRFSGLWRPIFKDVKLTVTLPRDTEKRLRAENPDLPAAVREGFLVNLFRRGKLTHSELAKAFGLDPHQTDAVLKRNTVNEQATLTLEKSDVDRGAVVRPERPHVPSRMFAVGPESEEALLEETIVAWQSRGPAAVWQAMFDMLGLWCETQGLDSGAQTVDRAHIEIHPVPWHASSAEHGKDA